MAKKKVKPYSKQAIKVFSIHSGVSLWDDNKELRNLFHFKSQGPNFN